MSWQLAAHADEIESKRRVSLSRLLASSERDAVDYFLITKAKLWWEHPLSHLLYIPLPVWHHSICQPWLKWRNFPQFQIQLELEDGDEWGKPRPRRGGDVPKVLSMQMTGQTTCRYNGNNNSNNNNNNSNVVIFTGTHIHSHTHLAIEHLSM